MRFLDLRAALGAAVLALAPNCGPGDGPTVGRDLILDPRNAEIGALIDRCRVDDGACLALCEAVLKRLGESVDEVTFHECVMNDLAPDQVALSMIYEYPRDLSCGRRPAGRAVGPRPTSPGELCARMAELEAASVPAFLRLAGELTGHGAPPALVAAARRAAGDEIRHAARIGRLARALGGQPRFAAVAAAGREQTLVELACDNAAEGCVREAIGAAVALYQARAAAVPAVRRLFAGVGADEVRHAELALAIDRWARGVLGAGERRAIDEARAEAVAEALGSEHGCDDPAARRVLGMPDREAGRKLAEVTVAVMAG
jgi:bacterioferritin (cytochrome b1)